MATNFNAINRSASFSPTAAFPLDKRSYFEDKSTADSAVSSASEAGSSASTYYKGQLITVRTSSSVDTYEIGNDNTLHKLDRAEDRQAAIQAAIAALDSNSTEATSDSFLTYVELVDGKFDTTKTKTASNAATATKFNSQRTIKLTGSVTGEVSSDGASGWEIATTTNHNHDAVYVNVSGDSMPGQLKRDSDGGMWINGRDNALLRHTKSTSNSTFSPLISFKTKQGEISNGMIFGSSEDHLVWAYTTDADYNASPQVNEHVDLLKLSTDGKLTAKTFNAESDARLKENFQVPQFGTILDLPVYKFDYIRGPKNQIGCKAQDLQKICPEIVDENSDGYLSIQESKIVYLLLEEVKKLRKEIDELKR